MESNSKEFLQAANIVTKLKSNPTNDEKLILYGLYKQAKFGDNNTNKPSFIDFTGLKKWNAWNNLKNKSKFDSEVEYIKKVNLLIKKYGFNK